MLEIYAVNIREEISEKEYNKLINCISNEKRNIINKLFYSDDVLRSLYGEIIVRSLIIQKKCISKQCIQFVYNKYGKPSVLGVPDFEFNISHSGDWVVCATGKKKVGLDIEKINSVQIDIAERFFNINEFNDLKKKTELEQIDYFYDLWTLKESYIKWTGKGLSIPLNSFWFVRSGDEYIIHPSLQENISFKQIEIEAGYKVTVCSEERFEQNIKIKSIKDIII